MAGLASGSDFARIAQEITNMALSSPNPGAVLKQYKMNPEYRLAAFIADGMVQQATAAKSNQQALDNYNPNQPTVLDQRQQPQDQGMAAMPTSRDMFNPSAYEQGGIGAGLGGEEEQPVAHGARGGVVAFEEGGASRADLRNAQVAAEQGAESPKRLPNVEEPVSDRASVRNAQVVAEREALAAEEAAAAQRAAAAKQGVGSTPEALKVAEEAENARKLGMSAEKLAAQRLAAARAGLTAEEFSASLAAQAAKTGATRGALATIGTAAGAVVGVPLAAYTGYQIGDKFIKAPYGQRVLGNLTPDASVFRRAGDLMSPGGAQIALDERKLFKAAGVDPASAAIYNIVSSNESSAPFHSPEALGRVNPGKTSFGSFQFDVSGALPGFVKEHGAKFGLTAPIGTDEFVKQWKTAAEKNPVEFGAAQVKTFKKEYVDSTQNQLAGLLPGKIDPKVLAYFVDRSTQLGGKTVARDKAAISDMYNSADGDTAKFLKNMSEWDKQQYERHFRTEAGKAGTDKSKYTYAKYAARIGARLTKATGMDATDRMLGQIEPAVQAVGDWHDWVVEKTTDVFEHLRPITPDAPKPAAPTPAAPTPAYAQAQAAAAPKETGMSPEEAQQRKNIALALMLSGAKGLSGTSQHAMVNLGAGAEEGLKGFIGLNQTQQAAKAKALEKAQDRAEKMYKDDVALAIAERKRIMNLDFDANPELNVALAKLSVLEGMSPSVRRMAQVDDAELGRLRKYVATLRAQGDKAGAGKVGATGGTGYKPTPAQQAALDKYTQ
jgi:hypothetical protein